MREHIRRYIKKNIDKKPLFTPSLSGNTNKLLYIRAIAKKHDSNWQMLQQPLSHATKLPLRTAKKTYVKGDALTIEVTLPSKGYLNIIAVNAKDEVTVLFPNGYESNNQLSPGHHLIPGQYNFKPTATAPFGSTLVAAYFTQEPLNLYKTGNDRHNSKNVLRPLFQSLSAAAFWDGMSAASKIYGNALTLQVCSNSAC